LLVLKSDSWKNETGNGQQVTGNGFSLRSLRALRENISLVFDLMLGVLFWLEFGA
jgi:hypothetical protein